MTGSHGATNLSGTRPGATMPEGDDAGLVTVFCTNATRTSGGNGPGPVQVPRAEASWLISQRIAVPGDRPPPNWSGPVS